MRIILSDIEWNDNISEKQLEEEAKNNLFFSTNHFDNEINIKLDLIYDYKYDELETNIIEYQINQNFSYHNQTKNLTPYQIIAEYYFPLSGLTCYQGWTEFHGQHGFIRGNGEYGKNKPTNKTLQENEIKLDTKYGVAIFYDRMEHINTSESELNQSFIVARRSAFSAVIEKDRISYPDILDNIREFVRVTLNILSLLEQNPCEWNNELIILSDKSAKTILTKETYRRTIKLKENSKISERTRRYRTQILSLLCDLINKYHDYDENKKKVIDHIIRSYKYACISQTLEISLLYWHSCLDLIKKYLGYPKNPFSEKLKKACGSKVQFDDLSFNMSKENISKFRFNEIRDIYIHDGFIIDDYDEVIIEIRKMRALTERLFLALFDINWVETKIGIPTFPI